MQCSRDSSTCRSCMWEWRHLKKTEPHLGCEPALWCKNVSIVQLSRVNANGACLFLLLLLACCVYFPLSNPNPTSWMNLNTCTNTIDPKSAFLICETAALYAVFSVKKATTSPTSCVVAHVISYINKKKKNYHHIELFVPILMRSDVFQLQN